MDGLSLNITQTQIEKLKALFPEAVSEGKLGWAHFAEETDHRKINAML